MKRAYGLAVVLLVAALPWAARAEPDAAAAESIATKLGRSVAASSRDETFSTILADEATAASWRDTLVPFPPKLRRVGRACYERAAALAEREGDDALTFLAWIAHVCTKAHEAAATDVDALCALTYAEIAALRAAVARGQTTPAEAWGSAADRVLAFYEKNKDDGCAIRLALDLLHEASRVEGMLAVPFLDRAGTVCQRARKLFPEERDVAYAVAASYRDQAHRTLEESRRRSQASLRGYFETMEGLQHNGALPKDDTTEWNQLITYARSNKLTLKFDYLCRDVAVASKLVAVRVPILDRWRLRGASIEEQFEDEDLYRSIAFKVYDWDLIYYVGVHEVHGDNPKGLANLLLAQRLKSFEKVKRTKKPSRKRISAKLPSGILFEIEGRDHQGSMRRTRYFFFKVVKAEMTVALTIHEACAAPKVDPEFDAIIDSLVITKTSR